MHQISLFTRKRGGISTDLLPMRDSMPIERLWLQIIRQCVELDDKICIGIGLEEIGRLYADAGIRPDSIAFMKRLLSGFDFQEDPIIGVAFARYLYQAGWFEDARDVMQSIGEIEHNRDRYLLAELFSAVGPYERGINQALNLKEKLRDPERIDSELCLELIILHGLRNNNKLDELGKRYKALIHNRRFDDCIAFSVLLRFADLCLHLDEDFSFCIQCLERSAQIAGDRQQTHEQISAHLALVQQYGYCDLDQASLHLHLGANLSSDQWLHSPMVLNNTAAIELYKGNATDHNLRFLEDALILSTEKYDRALIRNNILVHDLMTGRTPNDYMIEDLCRISTDKRCDMEIRKITAFNLEKAYLRQGSSGNAYSQGLIWRENSTGIDRKY